jgi:carbamoyltransferase
MVSKGMVGGWFQGRMELGPRALGNRSVIADPRDVNVPSRLNTTIKRRPAFQPFCQSMLKENENSYLINPKGVDGSYMIMAFDSTKEGISKTPAVVHIDRSIRPQILERGQNPKFYRLVKEFKKITGVPTVLNTSFNRSNEPIVNTPEEAVQDLIYGKLDFLALGDYLVTQKNY